VDATHLHKMLLKHLCPSAVSGTLEIILINVAIVNQTGPLKGPKTYCKFEFIDFLFNFNFLLAFMGTKDTIHILDNYEIRAVP